jgi:hypothetical protein
VNRQQRDELPWAKELTDDEIWTIYITICAEIGCPGGFSLPDGLGEVPRDFSIAVTRNMLGWCSCDTLEIVQQQLRLAGEHELAAWLQRLRQKRQMLN